MRDSYTNPSETKRIESFEIFGLTNRIHETNRIFWDFWSYESNPRNGYLKKISTNPNHDTGSLKLSLRNESTKRIFKVRIRESGFASPPAWICKDLFRAIVLRICKDSWGFVGLMKTGRIFGKSVYKTNPRNKSFANIKDSWPTIRNESGFISYGTNRTFLESGFVVTLRYKSMFLWISYTIPASL